MKLASENLDKVILDNSKKNKALQCLHSALRILSSELDKAKDLPEIAQEFHLKEINDRNQRTLEVRRKVFHVPAAGDQFISVTHLDEHRLCLVLFRPDLAD